jgi:uncharacterized protein (TIGR01777 family)
VEAGVHILITGGTGFIGTALTRSLNADGHRVTILTRGRHASGDLCQYVNALQELPDRETIDGVVNLAGASLAERRWSAAYKRTLRDSRLNTTSSLVDWMAGRSRRPPVLVSASAIGYYGSQGDEPLVEDSAVVPGFAQALCADWEAAAAQAEAPGTRVCLARIGVVLDSDGGAMDQLRRPFRFGIANWLGDGRQWLSWVHRADVVAALRFLIESGEHAGPFNLTAPEPVTSRGFCDAMKRHTSTLITAPVPAPVMRLMLGEMAEELLLNGQRVLPARLQEAGFRFRYPALDEALAAIFQAVAGR